MEGSEGTNGAGAAGGAWAAAAETAEEVCKGNGVTEASAQVGEVFVFVLAAVAVESISGKSPCRGRELCSAGSSGEKGSTGQKGGGSCCRCCEAAEAGWAKSWGATPASPLAEADEEEEEAPDAEAAAAGGAAAALEAEEEEAAEGCRLKMSVPSGVMSCSPNEYSEREVVEDRETGPGRGRRGEADGAADVVAAGIAEGREEAAGTEGAAPAATAPAAAFAVLDAMCAASSCSSREVLSGLCSSSRPQRGAVEEPEGAEGFRSLNTVAWLVWRELPGAAAG